MAEDVTGYVGLDRVVAEERARARDLSVRSLAPDSIITSDYRSGRINFVIVDGVVERAFMG